MNLEDEETAKEVTEESLNKNFNLLQGDVIESINGIEIPYRDQITEILENNKNQTIEVSIRKGSNDTIYRN